MTQPPVGPPFPPYAPAGPATGAFRPGPYPPGPQQAGRYSPAAIPPAAHRPTPARPFALTLSALLTITASLQGLAGVLFGWLMIWAFLNTLNPADMAEGSLYHRFNRAQLSLVGGLAVPLLGFPLASFVLGFLVLMRSGWPRIALTALGVGCGIWLAIWQFQDLPRVAVPLGYIGFCLLLLWVPSVNAWLRDRDRSGTIAP